MIKNSIYSSIITVTVAVGETYTLKADEVMINNSIYRKSDIELAIQNKGGTSIDEVVLMGVKKRGGVKNLPAISVNYLEWLVDDVAQSSLGECVEKISTAIGSFSQEVIDFIERVGSDGGVIESPECVKNTTADFSFYPVGYKVGKAYNQKPDDGSGDFTVVRVGEQSRRNKKGDLEWMADNVPVYDYPVIGGCPVLSLPPVSTNEYLNSELNNIETITVTATSYTVSFYGTGTITFSGTYVGSLVGTGINDRVEITFTPTAGALISTDSGSVDKKQLENISYSTPYIRTVGVAYTRFATDVHDAGDSSHFNSEQGVLFTRMRVFKNSQGGSRMSLISNAVGSEAIIIGVGAGTDLHRLVVVQGGAYVVDEDIVATDVTQFSNLALAWDDLFMQFWIDGVMVYETLLINNWAINTFTVATLSSSASTVAIEGENQGFKVYKTLLNTQQLTDLTTNGEL